ncbi:MAG TPA: sensor domain-containing diguanylate cyclase [Pirellulales bacterium]|nr:sensor domain-containing diguanylate cyclase [Pirellulales bacterium]
MNPVVLDRLALAALCTREGVWDWDLASHVFFASARWHEMVGRANVAPLVHRDEWLALMHPHDRTRLLGDLEAFFASTAYHFEHEHRLLHGDGDYRWMAVRAVAVRDAQGRAQSLVGVQSDISDRAQLDALARYDALLDPLTQLAGRRWFARRLNRALERSARCAGYHFALLFIDLDNFKQINDGYGHLAGDVVLAEIARRLQAGVRPGDMASRRGGDEFTVLLDDLDDPDDAFLAAERIRAQLAMPIEVAGRQFCISASIGVAISSQGYVNSEAMLDEADRAMYKAKRRASGRGASGVQSSSEAPAVDATAEPPAAFGAPA